MQPPMIGTWTVQVNAVRPFTIHGDVYYELQVTLLDDATQPTLLIKIPQHASKGEPAVGQTLVLNFLMGQVTSAAKR